MQKTISSVILLSVLAAVIVYAPDALAAGEELQTKELVDGIGSMLEMYWLPTGLCTFISGIAILKLKDRRQFAPLLLVGGLAMAILGLAAPGLLMLAFGYETLDQSQEVEKAR